VVAGKPQLFVATAYAFANVDGLSRKALDLHVGLYNGYVKQVNALQKPLLELAGRSKLSDAEVLQKDGLVRRHAFEFNGMRLHELFFEQINGSSAGSGPSPGSMLMESMYTSSGGLDGWRNDVSQLAETRGVGWVVSARDRVANRLMNFWVSEHHLGMPTNLQTIAVFDIWEHAYLLDFAPSARRDYVAVLFKNLDWSVLEQRCLSQ
jgi:Fe-Mn family superoxide dismutase